MNRRWLQILLVIVGVLVVLGHLVALAFLGMGASSWLSGTAIGLALAVFGGAHLLLARSSGAATESRGKQALFGLLSLAIGIAEGLLAVQVRDAGWWLLVPWALTALAIGMLLAGPPVEKAARLAAFGFSSVLVFLSGAGDISGLSGFVIALAWSTAGAAGALGVGALAHTVMSRMHAGPAQSSPHATRRSPMSEQPAASASSPNASAGPSAPTARS